MLFHNSFRLAINTQQLIQHFFLTRKFLELKPACAGFVFIAAISIARGVVTKSSKNNPRFLISSEECLSNIKLLLVFKGVLWNLQQ